MSIRTIKQVLMDRDGLSATEADSQIDDAREALNDYLEDGDFESAHDICSEFFGLEPDYLFDLI